MRLLHTSDWHLGATLGDVSRDKEHQTFLDWLLATIVREQVDALLIAGDIFDATNPPATAQQMYYSFLARCHALSPHLDIVIIGGNHDSAGRLDAPAALLTSIRTHVVGGLPRWPDGQPDLDRLLVPLTDATGNTAAWCIALPFIRPFDVGAAENFIAGVEKLHADCFTAARNKRQPGQALVAMGHAFLAGGKLSDTERPVQRGNLDALPVDLFPDDIAYVALGHLHKAQRVAEKEHVRYSGSPLPLSFTEVNYQHQVVLVELDGETFVKATPRYIPRARDLKRIPSGQDKSLDEVLEELRQLPQTSTGTDALPPLVEVHVQLDKPQPTLRADIERALEGTGAHIVSIQAHYRSADNREDSPRPNQLLGDLDPLDVFRRRYRAKYPDGPIPSDLEIAFQELLEEVEQKKKEVQSRL